MKRYRSQEMFLYYLYGMHKITSSGQNFKGHRFAYLLNLLSTLLRRSGNFLLQLCLNKPYHVTPLVVSSKQVTNLFFILAGTCSFG